MTTATPDGPSPVELRPAVEHAKTWLLAMVADLLDSERMISPALLPDLARFIASANEAVRDYERLVRRLIS